MVRAVFRVRLRSVYEGADSENRDHDDSCRDSSNGSVAGRPFRFHPQAEAELEAAASSYDERRPGLGAEFMAAVRSKVRQVLVAPERWPLVKGTRVVTPRMSRPSTASVPLKSKTTCSIRRGRLRP
jgi:hypothetical protein